MIRTSFKLTNHSELIQSAYGPILHDVKSRHLTMMIKSKLQHLRSFSNLTNSNTYTNNVNITRINYNKHMRNSYSFFINNKKFNSKHLTTIENQDNTKNISKFNNSESNSTTSYNNSKFNKFSNASFLKSNKNNFILNQINSFKLKTYQEKRSVSYLLKTKEFESYTDMMNPTINYFAHSFIDRCSDRRKDQKWIDEQMKSDKAVFVLFHIDKVYLYICICSNVWNRMFILFISLF